MLGKLKKWFSKSGDDFELQMHLPANEEAKFLLLMDGIRIGTLYCQKGEWFFKYTDECYMEQCEAGGKRS